MEVAVTKAADAQKKYMAVCQQLQRIATNITKKLEWKWAVKEGRDKELQKVLGVAETAFAADEFAADYLATDAKDMKTFRSSKDDETFTIELRGFETLANKHIKTLSILQAKLKSRTTLEQEYVEQEAVEDANRDDDE